MARRLLILAGVMLLMTLPAMSQVDPYHDNIFVNGTFTSTNPCNGDFITGEFRSRLIANIVQPQTPKYDGYIQMIQQDLRGEGTGTPSGLRYKLTQKGVDASGVNFYDQYHFNPANGAVVIGDNYSFELRAYGAGSQGVSFGGRVHEHTVLGYADGYSGPHTVLHIWPFVCRAKTTEASTDLDFDSVLAPAER